MDAIDAILSGLENGNDVKHLRKEWIKTAREQHKLELRVIEAAIKWKKAEREFGSGMVEEVKKWEAFLSTLDEYLASL